MRNDEPVRRDVLQGLAAMPLAALLAQTGQAAAQPPAVQSRSMPRAWPQRSSSKRRSLDFSPISTENISFGSPN